MVTKTKKKEYKHSIIDYLNDLTINKKNWNDYTEAEQKGFLIFIVNRWLSMDYNLVDIINFLQKYTVGQLSQREVYNLYKGILPKSKLYIRYIKGSDTDKYDTELVDYLCKYYELSKDEINQYLAILFGTQEGIIKIRTILGKYGLEDKKINKLIKVK